MQNEIELNPAKNETASTHNMETAGQVFRDFVGGMYEEAKNHPLKLLAEAGASAALTVGALMLAPEAGAAAAVVATGAGLYEAGNGLMHLADDVKIVDNAGQTYSDAEVQKAHADIRALGSSTTDTLAMAGGGMTGFEAAKVAIAVKGLGGSMYPFMDGLNIRQGVYIAGAMNGVQDLAEHI